MKRQPSVSSKVTLTKGMFCVCNRWDYLQLPREYFMDCFAAESMPLASHSTNGLDVTYLGTGMHEYVHVVLKLLL